MPRPRRFSEQASPAQVAQAYAEGRSTRELEKQLGLSRWVVSMWCAQNGVEMRSRDDALERQRYFKSIEDERAEAQMCCWPSCRDYAGRGHLCDTHWGVVAGWEGRTCGWPRCSENRLWGPQSGLSPLCSYHGRRAEGMIS